MVPMSSLKNARTLFTKNVRHWTVSICRRKTARKTMNVLSWIKRFVAKEENVGILLMFIAVLGNKRNEISFGILACGWCKIEWSKIQTSDKMRKTEKN